MWAVIFQCAHLKNIGLITRKEKRSLIKILYLMNSVRRVSLFRLQISEFELGVIHYAGIEHQAADTLSRLPVTGKDRTLLEDDLSILTFS